MIPHTQLRVHVEGEQNGDCWATAMECVLRVPVGTLPRWEVDQCWGDHWYQVAAYLFHHHGLTTQRVNAELLAGRVQAEGYHLASGPSPRATADAPIYHAVVALAGEVVHDPHPSRSGVLRVEEWEFLVPVPDRWRDPDVYHPAGLPCSCRACPASTPAGARAA